MAIYTNNVANNINFGSAAQYTMTTAMSACAWMAIDGSVNWGCCLTRHSTASKGWYLDYGGSVNKKPSFALYNASGTGKLVSAATALSTGIWANVISTYDGSNLNIYINGISDAAPVAQSGNVNATTRDLIIGFYFDTVAKQPPCASVFDVRLYNRALTAAESLTIAKARGKDNIVSGLVLRTCVLDGYPEQNLNGVTIKDISPYNNSVTATGSPTAKADPGGITRPIGG